MLMKDKTLQTALTPHVVVSICNEEISVEFYVFSQQPQGVDLLCVDTLSLFFLWC